MRQNGTGRRTKVYRIEAEEKKVGKGKDARHAKLSLTMVHKERKIVRIRIGRVERGS